MQLATHLCLTADTVTAERSDSMTLMMMNDDEDEDNDDVYLCIQVGRDRCMFERHRYTWPR